MKQGILLTAIYITVKIYSQYKENFAKWLVTKFVCAHNQEILRQREHSSHAGRAHAWLSTRYDLPLFGVPGFHIVTAAQRNAHT